MESRNNGGYKQIPNDQHFQTKALVQAASSSSPYQCVLHLCFSLFVLLVKEFGLRAHRLLSICSNRSGFKSPGGHFYGAFPYLACMLSLCWQEDSVILWVASKRFNYSTELHNWPWRLLHCAWWRSCWRLQTAGAEPWLCSGELLGLWTWGSQQGGPQPPHHQRRPCWCRTCSSVRWPQPNSDGACCQSVDRNRRDHEAFQSAGSGTITVAVAAMLTDSNLVKRLISFTGDTLTVLVSLASSGTTPWSVRSARFSMSLEILTMVAQMLACTSLFVDLSKLTISSKPPTTERTFSPASCRLRRHVSGDRGEAGADKAWETKSAQLD